MPIADSCTDNPNLEPGLLAGRWRACGRAGTSIAHSLCFPLGSICYSLFLRRERSRQVSLVSTTLSAPPVREGLKGQESREGV